MINHFNDLRAAGRDLAGEARFMDALIPRGSSVLDAGCGNGRVGSALAERGHTVLGVDADAELVDAARSAYPEQTWLVGDLTELDVVLGDRPLFGAAVLAGNVMPYLAPDTEIAVLRQVAAHVEPDGPIVMGFDQALGYQVDDFDRHLAATGLDVEQRFATWDLRPWTRQSPFSVTVVRAR
jgi:2-polyprenyl-3-methyl-5-hydroxy-6-metoxy-1,4-benzoquinol methylase